MNIASKLQNLRLNYKNSEVVDHLFQKYSVFFPLYKNKGLPKYPFK